MKMPYTIGKLALILLGSIGPMLDVWACAAPPAATTGDTEKPESSSVVSDPSDRESRPGLFAAFRIAQVYDGNIYGSARTRLADSFTVFSPQINLERLYRSTQWFLDYEPEFRRYIHYSTLNNTTQAGTLGVRIQPTPRLKLGFSDRFARLPDAILLPVGATAPDRSILDPSVTSIVTERARRTYNRMTFAGQYDINYRSNVSVEAALSHLRFSRQDLTPYDNQSVSVRFAHQETARRTWLLSYGFSHFDFSGHARPANHHVLAGGLAVQLTRTLRGDVELGPSISTNGLQHVSGLDARVGIEKALSTLRLRAAYARSLGAAGGLSGAARNQSLLTSAHIQITRRTNLALSSIYSNYQSIFGRTVDLHNLLFAASLDVRLNRHVGWFVSYQQVHQSRVMLPDYSANFQRVALGLNLLSPRLLH